MTSTHKKAEAILHESLVPPHEVSESVPPELEQIILNCLQKNPEYRYQSARELLADFRRLTVQVPIEVRPAGRWLRLRRWLAAAALTLALILAGYLVRERFQVPKESATEPITLVVLPFHVLNSDADITCLGVSRSSCSPNLSCSSKPLGIKIPYP